MFAAWRRRRQERRLPWRVPRLTPMTEPLYADLRGRLDEVARRGPWRQFYFRDRETGQLWREDVLESGAVDIYGLVPVSSIPDEEE
jgi:hypothetical protein